MKKWFQLFEWNPRINKLLCMHIARISTFKNNKQAVHFFNEWVEQLETLNQIKYKKIIAQTELGNTVVWSCNHDQKKMPAIVLFPGFRTSALFWDLDNVLAPLCHHFRVYMVETNGQPSLSNGASPDVRTDDYGIWAAGVLKQLDITTATIAGVSFGAFVCKKLCMVNPSIVKHAVLMNPAGLQQFSPNFKNLYYNALPVLSTTEKNVSKFLEEAIFFKDNHYVSPQAFKLLIDYEMFAIRSFKNRSQFPYVMGKQELQRISTPTHLVLGEKDILFPFNKTIEAAEKNVKSLRNVYVLKNTGHGIETSPEAIEKLIQIAKN